MTDNIQKWFSLDLSEDAKVVTVYRLDDGREVERLDEHTYRIKETGQTLTRIYGSEPLN